MKPFRFGGDNKFARFAGAIGRTKKSRCRIISCNALLVGLGRKLMTGCAIFLRKFDKHKGASTTPRPYSVNFPRLPHQVQPDFRKHVSCSPRSLCYEQAECGMLSRFLYCVCCTVGKRNLLPAAYVTHTPTTPPPNVTNITYLRTETATIQLRSGCRGVSRVEQAGEGRRKKEARGRAKVKGHGGKCSGK